VTQSLTITLATAIGSINRFAWGVVRGDVVDIVQISANGVLMTGVVAGETLIGTVAAGRVDTGGGLCGVFGRTLLATALLLLILIVTPRTRVALPCRFGQKFSQLTSS